MFPDLLGACKFLTASSSGCNPINSIAEFMTLFGRAVATASVIGGLKKQPNQVWAMDINYIPMARGFIYWPSCSIGSAGAGVLAIGP